MMKIGRGNSEDVAGFLRGTVVLVGQQIRLVQIIDVSLGVVGDAIFELGGYLMPIDTRAETALCNMATLPHLLGSQPLIDVTVIHGRAEVLVYVVLIVVGASCYTTGTDAISFCTGVKPGSVNLIQPHHILGRVELQWLVCSSFFLLISLCLISLRLAFGSTTGIGWLRSLARDNSGVGTDSQQGFYVCPADV